MTLTQLPARQLARLYPLALHLGASLDLDEVLNCALQETVEALNATRGVILLHGTDDPRPLDYAVRGMDARVLDTPAFDEIRRIVEQVERERRTFQNPADSEAPSILCTPLHLNETPLGTLYLDRAQPAAPFHAEDRELVEAIAATAAVFLHNARLYRRAARAALELRRLYDTSLDITRQLDIDKLLDLIIRRAAELLHGDSGNFYFYDEKADELVPSAPYGQHVVEPVYVLKPGEGATGRVFLTGEPLIVQDYDTWEGRSPKIPLGRYARVLHVPVKRGASVLGVMSVNRSRADPPYNEDDVRLLSLFANQAAIAVENTRLVQVAIDKARIERELQVAHQVQSSLIPRATPQIPGWEFSTRWRPARQVSGDFYDFVRLSDGRLGFVIGDVAGKGMPAALVMATTRALLRGPIYRGSPPGQVLEYANELVLPDIPPKTFVTAFYAILEPETGRLQYANAGHNLPLLSNAGNIGPLRANGVPLGLMPGMRYEEKEITLARDDMILFYSDGLVEAHNSQREMFGIPRLVQSLGRAGKQDTIDRLLAELAAFTGPDGEQEDDITLVTCRRHD
jgi:serine phosphatase RsbU (regulator of sigma subunit)